MPISDLSKWAREHRFALPPERSNWDNDLNRGLRGEVAQRSPNPVLR